MPAKYLLESMPCVCRLLADLMWSMVGLGHRQCCSMPVFVTELKKSAVPDVATCQTRQALSVLQMLSGHLLVLC